MMKLIKSFNSTTRGDVPIAVIEKHKNIANQFFVMAFSCMQKSTTPIHPDKTYWNNLSFILNYRKDAIGFGGYGRFQPFVTIALFKFMSSSDEKEYSIEVPRIFSSDNFIKSFTGNIQMYIANQCAIHLAETIRKYLQNNSLAQQNPLINAGNYERSSLLSPNGIVFQDVYKFLYTNLLIGELQELDSLTL
jgi:hypothetical protein